MPLYVYLVSIGPSPSLKINLQELMNEMFSKMMLLGLLLSIISVVCVLAGPLGEPNSSVDPNLQPRDDFDLCCEVSSTNDAGYTLCQACSPQDERRADANIRVWRRTKTVGNMIRVASIVSEADPDGSLDFGKGIPAPRVCCKEFLKDVWGQTICSADLCYPPSETLTGSSAADSLDSRATVRIIRESNGAPVSLEDDEICCLYISLWQFDCSRCGSDAGDAPQISNVYARGEITEGKIKLTRSLNRIGTTRKMLSLSEPCCFEGAGTPVYDCNQCKNGPQDIPPSVERSTEPENSPEVSNTDSRQGVIGRAEMPDSICCNVTESGLTCDVCDDRYSRTQSRDEEEQCCFIAGANLVWTCGACPKDVNEHCVWSGEDGVCTEVKPQFQSAAMLQR